jgi:hypothetical protein
MKKVASVLVSWDGFRDPAAQDDRRSFAADIATYCYQQRAEVVLLPAGYLLATSDTESTVRKEAEALARRFKGMSLAAGIDSRSAAKLGHSKSDSRQLLDDWTRKGTLPFWVFASNPAGIVLDMFRQRSSTSQNAGMMPTPTVTAKQKRTVHCSGLNCYLLACGELFNSHLRGVLGGQHGIDLIVHLAHGGLGRTLPTTFPKLARASGAWIINAQHTSNGWCWAGSPAGSVQKVSGSLIRASSGSSGLWAQIAFWNVP